MTHGTSQATANALKATGAIVHVEEKEFREILYKMDSPLVVEAPGGVFSKKTRYIMSYKGLVFYTKAESQIQLPPAGELIRAKRIWIPDY